MKPDAIHADDLSLIISTQQEIATASLNSNDLKQLICKRAQFLTRAAGAVVEVLIGDEMSYAATSGSVESSLGFRLKAKGSLSGLCFFTKEILVCEDSETDPRVNAEACRKVNVRSMIVVPLVNNGEALGVLKVLSPKPNFFTAREKAILQLVAGLLSASLAQSRLVTSLQKSEAKYRHLVDASYSAITVAIDGIITEANAGFCEMFGYGQDEIIGVTAISLVTQEAALIASAKIGANFDRPYELTGLRKDGTTFPIESVGKTTIIDGKRVRVTAVRDITERKKIEESLRASEMRFRSVLHSVNDSIIAANKKGEIVAWNRAAEVVFGYTEAEALGKPLTMLMPERFRAMHTAGMSRVTQTGQSKLSGKTVELVGIKKSGEEFPIELSLASWKQDDEIYFTSVIRDLTDKKAAEYTLKETTKTLQTLITSSPVGILLLDADLRLTMWNPACEKMFGWKAEEALGKPLPFVPNEKRYESNHILKTMAATRSKVETQAERVRKDGSAIFIHISAMPLMNDRDEVHAHMAVVIDITDQVHASAELKAAHQQAEREKAFSESVTNLAPNAIFVASVDHNSVIYSNRQASIIHANEENFISRSMHPDDRQGYEAHKEKLLNLADGAAVEFEWRAKNNEGQWQFFAMKESIFRRSLDGRPEQVIGVAEDITELRQKEAEILEANKALSAATKAKSEFLANMSHEIRTPLNGVIGMASLLMDTPLNDEQRDYTEAVRTSAETLLTLINDILDFSKVEAGKLHLEVIDFEIDQVVQDIEKTIGFSANKKGLSLFKSRAHSVPEHFKGDPTRIRQVLLNLVSNAVKFTPTGHVRIEIREQGLCEGGMKILFEVTDTGIGIPDEAMSRMFQAFSQADSSTTRKYGGTGLGLSICKHLVTLMGGEIGVRSEVGKGSTFWFSLPLQVGDAPTAISIKGVAMSLPQQRLRILVAEDISVNQIIAVKILERLGHSAMAVANGLEVLDSLRDTPFDLVFMDCQMPEMDGYEATRIIRTSKSLNCTNIPIIAMTANAMEGDREKCLAAGMDDYISKPIKSSDLDIVLQKILKAKLAA